MVKNVNHNALEKSNRTITETYGDITIKDALNVRINCLLSTERSNDSRYALGRFH